MKDLLAFDFTGIGTEIALPLFFHGLISTKILNKRRKWLSNRLDSKKNYYWLVSQP